MSEKKKYPVIKDFTDHTGSYKVGQIIECTPEIAALGRHYGNDQDVLGPPTDPATDLRDAAQTKYFEILAQDIAQKTYDQMLGKKVDSWEKYGADFVRAVARRDGPYLQKHFGSTRHQWPAAEILTAKAAMAQSSGVTGGYTVPQQLGSAVLAPLQQKSVFRANGAMQLPSRYASLQVPFPDVTTPQAAGVPPWAGGLAFQWASEGALRPESEPQFKQAEIVKAELTAYLTISRPLLDDSPGLQALLARLIAQAVSWIEDLAFFQGAGLGQPLGVIGSPASIAVTRAAPTKIEYADVSGMLSKLIPSSLGNAIFAFNPTCQTQLLQLADGSNRAVFLSAGAAKAGDRPQWTLAGLPAIPTDTLPPLGIKGDLCLIDPSLYAIVDHGEAAGGTIEMIFSEHVDFLSNEVVLRVVRRTGGEPLLDKPITLGDGVSQASPFVVLN